MKILRKTYKTLLTLAPLGVTGFLPAQVNLTSSLTACYALNGNAIETVNALHGTLVAVSPAADRFNSPGSALAFAGSTASYVELPNNAHLKPAKAVTIAGWFKPTSLTGNTMLVYTKNIFTNYFAAYTLAFHSYGGGHKFYCGRANGSVDFVCTGTTNIVANTWYHAALTIDSTVMKIYVNGVLENSMSPPFAGFLYDATRNVILGGTKELNWNAPYTGVMDNLRFYSRTLSAAEISALYAQDPSCSAGILPPVASFSVNSTALCAGDNLYISDLSSNSPLLWSWTVSGPSQFTTSAQHPSLALNAPGSYTVSLTTTNAGGNSTSFQVINVFPYPTLSILSPNNPVCAAQPFTLIASGAGSYTWNTGQTGPVLTTTIGSTSLFGVTGTGPGGCTASSSLHTQFIKPSPSVSISGPAQSCLNSTLTFVAGGAQSYTWNTGQTAPVITHTVLSNATIAVTGMASNGCTAQATASIAVAPPLPVQINASDTLVCPGDQLILTASGALNYQWSTFQQGNPFTVAPSSPASYTVTGTDANGCSGTASVFVNTLPLPVVSAQASSGSSVVCRNSAIFLSASGALSYSWSTSQVGATVVAIPTVSTVYTVTGTDSSGCSNTAIVHVVVAFCAGINAMAEDVFRVYPNPFGERVTIEAGIPADVTLYDANGRIITERRVTGKDHIDASGLAKGVYLLRLSNGSATRSVKIFRE